MTSSKQAVPSEEAFKYASAAIRHTQQSSDINCDPDTLKQKFSIFALHKNDHSFSWLLPKSDFS